MILAAGCAVAPPRPVTALQWPLDKEYESYVAADDSRVLLVEAPAGVLRFSCAVRGEGAYARVVVKSGDLVLTRGTCGGSTDLKDLPAGPVRAEALMVGGAGVLRMTFTPGPRDAAVEAVGKPPEDALFSALQRRDTAALDALLTDDFPDKAAFIQREGGFQSYELSDLQVRFHGDAASVTLVASFPAAQSVRVSDTWVRDNGRWRLLSRQTTPAP